MGDGDDQGVGTMTREILHIGVSVDIDRFSDRTLAEDWLPFLDFSTVAELREACAQARARGLKVFPNPACVTVQPNGGCGGCPDPDDEARRAVVAAAQAIVKSAVVPDRWRLVVIVTGEDGAFVGVSSNTSPYDTRAIIDSALVGADLRLHENEVHHG